MAIGILYLGTAIIFLAVFHLVSNYFAAGVRRVPGPFIAALTDLFRAYDVGKGCNQVSLIALHKKYGDNVRLGPRVVSIRNLIDVNKVYNVKNGFSKVRNPSEVLRFIGKQSLDEPYMLIPDLTTIE